MHIHIIVDVNSFGLSISATLCLPTDMLEYFLIPVMVEKVFDSNVGLIQSDAVSRRQLSDLHVSEFILKTKTNV